MVLLIHTGAQVFHGCPLDSSDFLPLLTLSTAVRGSVPIFFMLSGALFLDRQELCLRDYLKKHVLYLAAIFFIWSAIYALGSRAASGSFGSVYNFVYELIAGHYHMWFLSAMVLCYLFLPPLSCALHGQRLDIRYLLFLFFGVSMLCANLNLTPDTAPILYRFTQNLSLDYLPYLGYAVWGYWLSRREFSARTLYLAPLVFLLCTALTTGANLWYSGYKGEADGWLFSYFSIPSFIQASAVFCFFLALRGREFRHKRFIRQLSDCTMGVYLIHPLFINVFEALGFKADRSSSALYLLFFTAVLAIVCFSVTAVSKKIPPARFLLFPWQFQDARTKTK